MKTYINVILDKSGSMASVWKETIDGFNTWLAEQKKAVGKQQLTLTLFDTEITTKGYEDISSALPLTKQTYVPGGFTALLDAIGRTVRTVPVKAKKVLVVIITDGEENSSHEFSRDAIKELIKERELEGWTFAYIGASLDGFADAGKLGIGIRSTYVPTGTGTQGAFTAMSGSTIAYAAAATPDMAYQAYQNSTVTNIPDPADKPTTKKK